MAQIRDLPTGVPSGPRRGRLRRGPDGDALPQLSLTLLGGFCLRCDDAVLELPTGAQRLAALLALRGRTSRSRVAGTLWPETTEHRALASLRTGIWRINQATGRLITSRGGTLDVGASVDVDVRRAVRTALSSMRDAAAAVGDADPVLDDGELLPGWADDWVLADRERLRQLRLHVLEAVAERLSGTGQYGLALEVALAALRTDALRESAHRTLIRIHLAEGNVVEARRAYDACRELLLREVGVEPSSATTHIISTACPAPRVAR